MNFELHNTLLSRRLRLETLFGQPGVSALCCLSCGFAGGGMYIDPFSDNITFSTLLPSSVVMPGLR